MSISCIIVEDQPPAQRVLKKYIADIGTLELSGVFSDALSALEFLRIEQVDLIFLDIHLPKLSGMEFLKIMSPGPKVILTTAFSDYALEGYELDVVDYLLKPFSFERFVRAVNKVSTPESLKHQQLEKDHSIQSSKHLFVKSGSEFINIYFDDVLFIKSDGDYTMVYLYDSRHLVSNPLKYWLEILPEKSFGQVHKSFIVNAEKIRKISGGQIYISDHEIPIGRTYKESFYNKFLKD